MSGSNQHQMKLAQTYPSGAQEWICPTCGRWLVMLHQPEQGRLKTIVLEAGDEAAAHESSVGAVRVPSVQVVEQSEADLHAPPAGTLLH